MLGTGFSAEQHRVAAHAFHPLAQRTVCPPKQQNQRQKGNHHVQHHVPDGGVLVDRAELHARVLQPGNQVGILRNGVSFVRFIVIIYKVNLLILNLDGFQLLGFQHLQKAAVAHAFDLCAQHGGHQKYIKNQHQRHHDGVTEPKLLFWVLGGCGFFHTGSLLCSLLLE